MVVSYIYYFHPYLGRMNPFWQAYFSDGLKPPTSFVCFLHRIRASWKGCSCDDAAMVIQDRSESSPPFRGIYWLQLQANRQKRAVFFIKRFMKFQIGIFCKFSTKNPGMNNSKCLDLFKMCCRLHRSEANPRMGMEFSKPQNFDLGKRLISCWFQIFSIFTPILGEDSHFD